MKYHGRISSIGLCLLIQTFYLLYFYFPDKNVDWVIWWSYPVLIAISYWTGKHYDKATFYSERDPLTNLYNRRFVTLAFDKILAIANRTNSNIFVLLIDCDHFKKINDQYNHQTGDMVLLQISQLLTANTRKSDIVARWGGDEFLIIGHHKDEAGLQVLLHRIQNESVNFSINMGFPISLSIGSATSSTSQYQDLTSLLKIADENMYRSKTKKVVT